MHMAALAGDLPTLDALLKHAEKVEAKQQLDDVDRWGWAQGVRHGRALACLQAGSSRKMKPPPPQKNNRFQWTHSLPRCCLLPCPYQQAGEQDQCQWPDAVALRLLEWRRGCREATDQPPRPLPGEWCCGAADRPLTHPSHAIHNAVQPAATMLVCR